MQWMTEKIDRTGETEVERLIREANELDQQAEHMKGCSWMGDEPPWAHLQRSATDKRMLAAYMKMAANTPPKAANPVTRDDKGGFNGSR